MNPQMTRSLNCLNWFETEIRGFFCIDVSWCAISNRKLNACWVIFASGSTTATPPGNTRCEGFVSFGLFGFCRFVQNSCVSGDTNANRREAPLLMILIQSWPGLKMNRFTLLIVISFLLTSLYLWFFTRGLWLGFQHYTVFKTYYGTRADNYHAMYILLI